MFFCSKENRCFENIFMITLLKYYKDLSSWSFFLYQLCPILFNLYRMKLNEGYFSVKTAITYFCDKFFQEVNFKSHLNSALRCKYGKIL